MQRPPTHPGAILKHDVLPALNGVTQAAFADHIGVSRQTLSKILNGHARITPEIALALGAALRSDARFWLNMQTNYDLSAAMETVERLPEPLAAAG